jgi:hypothetical protein
VSFSGLSSAPMRVHWRPRSAPFPGAAAVTSCSRPPCRAKPAFNGMLCTLADSVTRQESAGRAVRESSAVPPCSVRRAELRGVGLVDLDDGSADGSRVRALNDISGG